MNAASPVRKRKGKKRDQQACSGEGRWKELSISFPPRHKKGSHIGSEEGLKGNGETADFIERKRGRSWNQTGLDAVKFP